MKKKCFFIATSAPTTALPAHFWKLGEELAAKGHQALMLIDKQHYELEKKTGDVLIYSWPSRRPTQIKDAVFLWKLIRQHRPDCLIANFGAINWMLIIGWMTKVPVRAVYYHTMREFMTIGKLKKLFLYFRARIIHGLAACCITPSFAAKADCATALKVSENKIYVLRNSVCDLRETVSVSSTGIKKNILCCGRIVFMKGQQVLIKAADRLISQDWEMNFVGDGSDVKRCKELSESCKYPDKIFFLGSMPAERVYKVMASAYIVVVPSYIDNVPLVIAEALSLGIPIIASNCGGIPEMIRDGEEGFLVAPGDDQQLAEKLDYLLTHPEVHEKMKKSCRLRFLDLYEQRKIIAEQAQWYIDFVSSFEKEKHLTC